MALLLLRRAPGGNATVSVAHSRTADLGGLTRTADVLIVAVGRPNTITRDMVKPGVTVIDVGTNRVEDPTRERGYRVVGDVDFEGVSEVAAAITPVPGGVGPMTIAMLLANTVEAAIRLRKAAGDRPAPSTCSRTRLRRTAGWTALPNRTRPRLPGCGRCGRSIAPRASSSRRAFPHLWVGGEVTNFRRQRSGHCYFTLKDEVAQIRCVMFRRDAAGCRADPDEGMTLRVFGGSPCTRPGASSTGRVEARDRERRGHVEARLRPASGTARRRGLTDPGRKRALPAFPGTVGIVTSPTSAALRDIVAVIARRAPWLRLLVRGTRVQGVGAGDEIAAAVSTLAEVPEVDVIIVARGGGSIEDLWGFNEEAVARAVALEPGAGGIGSGARDRRHDLRSGRRCPAADAVGRRRSRGARSGMGGEALEGMGQRLDGVWAGQMRSRRWWLDQLGDALFRRGRRRVHASRDRLDAAQLRMAAAVRARIRRDGGRLSEAAAALDALSPLSDARPRVRRATRPGRETPAQGRGLSARAGLQVACRGRVCSLRGYGASAERRGSRREAKDKRRPWYLTLDSTHG